MKNSEAAKEALSDMPPRLEEELDPVTLHNQVREGKITHTYIDTCIIENHGNDIHTYLPTLYFIYDTGIDSYG